MCTVFYLLYEEPCNVDVANKPLLLLLLLLFKVFHTIYMHQFGWLSGRGGIRKGGGSLRKRGVPTLEETMGVFL